MTFLLVQDLIKMAERQLNEANVPDAKHDAEEMYCYLKKVPRAKFFMEWSEPADDRTCDQFFDLVARRAKREPLQYITGIQEFMGYPIAVEPNVLIPRLDTEVVVDKAVELFREKKGDTVLDLCCGSGAIGIAIAKKTGAKVTATDINPVAKSLTEKNARTNGIKMEALLGDLYEPIKKKKYHMIISNPPYIKTAKMETLMPEVKDFEPKEALDGGFDGLDFYRKIIEGAASHLKKEGLFVLEIGHDQSNAVTELILETEKFFDINTHKDLAGNDRAITARLLGKR